MTQTSHGPDVFRIGLPDGATATVTSEGASFTVWIYDGDQGYRSAWKLSTFEAAVRNIMDVVWEGCLPFEESKVNVPDTKQGSLGL